jgi:RNA polymerase sigma-70 factor (ECF subfamily)
LQAVLDRLPPRAREAFLLQQLDGFSRKEIAVRMGVGEETVKSHLQTAGELLADMLFGEPPDLRRTP